jgi:glycosyltransferase involved in cell wall biosynthesis
MPRDLSANAWHFVTCSYPPEIGGLAGYSSTVADALHRGGAVVHVWCPGAGDRNDRGIAVHAAPGRWRLLDLGTVGRELSGCAAPRTLFVQWVPHGYGYRSLNVAFVAWLAWRVWRDRDRLELMVHEPWLEIDLRRPRVAVAALVHRFMAWALARSATRIWVSIPAWLPLIRRLAPSVEIGWLPVPGLLPVVRDAAAVSAVRDRLSPDHVPVVGHYGTYGELITGLLAPSLERLLESRRDVRVVLMGLGSREFRERWMTTHPELASRVFATGVLEERDLSLHIQSCDVLLQPYPDGVSARRSTAVSLLAHGAATVTTLGHLSEGLWAESGAVDAVALDPAALAAAVRGLLDDPAKRQARARAAVELYERVFDVRHTTRALSAKAPRAAA